MRMALLAASGCRGSRVLALVQLITLNLHYSHLFANYGPPLPGIRDRNSADVSSQA